MTCRVKAGHPTLPRADNGALVWGVQQVRSARTTDRQTRIRPLVPKVVVDTFGTFLNTHFSGIARPTT